jgi:hypothetical protein
MCIRVPCGLDSCKEEFHETVSLSSANILICGEIQLADRRIYACGCPSARLQTLTATACLFQPLSAMMGELSIHVQPPVQIVPIFDLIPKVSLIRQVVASTVQ